VPVGVLVVIYGLMFVLKQTAVAPCPYQVIISDKLQMVKKYSKILFVKRLIYFQLRGKKQGKKNVTSCICHISAEDPWIHV
jgi:hypothetical protein